MDQRKHHRATSAGSGGPFQPADEFRNRGRRNRGIHPLVVRAALGTPQGIADPSAEVAGAGEAIQVVRHRRVIADTWLILDPIIRSRRMFPTPQQRREIGGWPGAEAACVSAPRLVHMECDCRRRRPLPIGRALKPCEILRPRFCFRAASITPLKSPGSASRCRAAEGSATGADAAQAATHEGRIRGCPERKVRDGNGWHGSSFGVPCGRRGRDLQARERQDELDEEPHA